MVVQDTGLRIESGRNVVFVTIISIQSTDAQKQALYKAMAEELKIQCDIDPRHVMVSLVMNSKSDWSFGLGEAQFLTGKL